MDSLTPAFAAIWATVAPGILAAARATLSAEAGLRVTRFAAAGVAAGVASTAGAGKGSVLWSLVWAAGIAVVFYPVAMRAYRAKT